MWFSIWLCRAMSGSVFGFVGLRKVLQLKVVRLDFCWLSYSKLFFIRTPHQPILAQGFLIRKPRQPILAHKLFHQKNLPANSGTKVVFIRKTRQPVLAQRVSSLEKPANQFWHTSFFIRKTRQPISAQRLFHQTIPPSNSGTKVLSLENPANQFWHKGFSIRKPRQPIFAQRFCPLETPYLRTHRRRQ